MKKKLGDFIKKNRLIKTLYWIYSYFFLLVYIILLLFFIYLKSELETSLVYEVDMSYNAYKWINFLISFIEFVSIGLILSSISEVKKMGELVWEKNAEFVAVVEVFNEKAREIRRLVMNIMALKIKMGLFPFKNMLLKINLKSKQRKLYKKDKKIEKLEKILIKKNQEIEKIKRENSKINQ